MSEIELAKDLTYEEKPIRILDQTERVTRSKALRIYKVQWEHHTEAEATWEREEFLRTAYPEWFSQATESRGRDSFKVGEVCDSLDVAFSLFTGLAFSLFPDLVFIVVFALI